MPVELYTMFRYKNRGGGLTELRKREENYESRRNSMEHGSIVKGDITSALQIYVHLARVQASRRVERQSICSVCNLFYIQGGTLAHICVARGAYVQGIHVLLDARVYKNVTTVRLNATRHTMSSSTNVRSLQACAERVGIQMTIYTPCYYDERNETRSVRFIEIRLKIGTKLQFVLLRIRDGDTYAYTYALYLRAKSIETRHTETRRTFHSTAKSKRDSYADKSEINFPFPHRP